MLLAVFLLDTFYMSCTSGFNQPHQIFSLFVLYCIALYCIEGVFIAAQCTATFSRSIVLPRIYVLLGCEYAD